MPRFALVSVVAIVPWLAGVALAATPPRPATPEEVVDGLQRFYRATARPDGSFRPGVDPDYLGMSDSAYSDLAAVTYACTLHRTFGWKLPHEEKTIAFLMSRQKENGDFFNVAGTVDPKSPEGRVYNTTQGLVALRALGVRPEHDPLPVFEAILKADYKTLPAYSTSFFPLAYLCYGKPIPEQADHSIRALMVQDETGYLNDHVAATFHASHYYALVGEPTPKGAQMVNRILRDQKPDGSWMLNMPSRDRHATYDAVFTLTHEAGNRDDVRAAVRRAAEWALLCRNDDGGFGHFPGSTSDADAIYFQVGTLVMAGFLDPVNPLPRDPHLLSWGHLMPVRERKYGDRRLVSVAKASNATRGPTVWVGGVAFSSDARSLATAKSDRTACVCDLVTGKCTAQLQGHTDTVVAVAFSPDGKLLATGSHDRTARLWDLATGDALHTLRGHHGAVTSVAFSPDGSHLATGSLDGTIFLWDPAAGEPRKRLVSHKSWVNAVAFSPDGRSLVSGSSDGTLKVWSIPDGELTKTIRATNAEIRSIALSPDGATAAAGLRYGAIKTWNTADWREQHSIAAHEGDVWSLAFTSDGKHLISGNGDWNRPGVVKRWDAATGKLVAELKHTGEVLAIAVGRDGSLAAGGWDGAVSIWGPPDAK